MSNALTIKQIKQKQLFDKLSKRIAISPSGDEAVNTDEAIAALPSNGVIENFIDTTDFFILAMQDGEFLGGLSSELKYVLDEQADILLATTNEEEARTAFEEFENEEVFEGEIPTEVEIVPEIAVSEDSVVNQVQTCMDILEKAFISLPDGDLRANLFNIKTQLYSVKRDMDSGALATANFKSDLNTFLEKTWQEDTEIESVDLVKEYSNEESFRERSDVDWKSFLKRLYKENQSSLIGKTSENFISELESILGDSTVASYKVGQKLKLDWDHVISDAEIVKIESNGNIIIRREIAPSGAPTVIRVSKKELEEMKDLSSYKSEAAKKKSPSEKIKNDEEAKQKISEIISKYFPNSKFRFRNIMGKSQLFITFTYGKELSDYPSRIEQNDIMYTSFALDGFDNKTGELEVDKLQLKDNGWNTGGLKINGSSVKRFNWKNVTMSSGKVMEKLENFFREASEFLETEEGKKILETYKKRLD